MLCRKNSVIFQSNAPCTCAFCTFWGVDITPKPPSGRHASVGMTQQLERLALREIVLAHLWCCAIVNTFCADIAFKNT